MPQSVKRCWNPQHNLSISMTTIKLWNGSRPFKAATSEFIFPALKSLWCYDYSLLLCNCPAVTGSVWMFQSSHLNCSLCLSVQIAGSGPHAVMLSLDEPLDLKVPRGRVSGRDRGTRSPPTLTHIHARGAGQLRMADDGTAVIIPASPASPHTGKQFSTAWRIQHCNCRESNRGVYVHRCPAG